MLGPEANIAKTQWENGTWVEKANKGSVLDLQMHTWGHRIEIAWRVNLQGSVSSARVARSTMNNSRVEGCIVRQVRRWRFPRPDGGEVSVQYPFIFGVQGG